MMARVNSAVLRAGSVECPHDSVFCPHVGAPFKPFDHVQYLFLVHHFHLVTVEYKAKGEIQRGSHHP